LETTIYALTVMKNIALIQFNNAKVVLNFIFQMMTILDSVILVLILDLKVLVKNKNKPLTWIFMQVGHDTTSWLVAHEPRPRLRAADTCM
jgi:hypothetical protein